MSKQLTVLCPKDKDRRYFSKEIHGYENSLDVIYNGKKLFAEINDAEENLPWTFISYGLDDVETLIFDYNINWHKKVFEDIEVRFTFSNNHCYAEIDRKNFVEGSDDLEIYEPVFVIGSKEFHFGKELHQGDTKLVKFDCKLDTSQDFEISWYARKKFTYSDMITYDHIITKVQNET